MAYCAIKSKLTGYVISIERDSSVAGTPLDVFDQQGAYTDNQLWEFVPHAPNPGQFFIKSKLNGDVITVTGNWLAGAGLAAFPQESESVPQLDNQLWQFVLDPAGSGYYFIQNYAYGNVVDISGNSRQSGAGLDSAVLKLTDNANQLWEAKGGSFPPPVAMASPPTNMGGSQQYVLWGGTDPEKAIPIEDFVVYIHFSEALVVSPQSGVTPKNPTPQPIGFQLNGVSPLPDAQTGDRYKINNWQQYIPTMLPGTNQLWSHVENYVASGWKGAVFDNTIPANGIVTLPNDLTIPQGWTIQLALQYLGGGVSGMSNLVWDEAGVTQGEQTYTLINQPMSNGNTIQEDDLAPILALQLVIVGYANGADPVLTSGAGTITCTSSTPMTVRTSWPPNGSGNGDTGENSNSTYGLMPAAASTRFVQSFGHA
jgi:Ricin-type beta-trefoil lectin domain-like